MDQTKSCLNCPSYLKSDHAVSKFKKSIGAPICGRYGIPLGRPGASKQQETNLGILFANKCDAFGEPATPLPQEERFVVALPDPVARIPDDRDFREPIPEVRTCGTCVNFIRDDVVQAELGWTTGMCAAKGKLILPTRQTTEARGCEYKKFGPIRSSTSALTLLPEYEEGFQLNTDPIKAYFKNKTNFVDPTDYVTDKEVTSADQTAGIRAWRVVKDPNGSGNQTYLPIYRADFFAPEEAVKIPHTGDDEHPELYVDHFGGLYTIAVNWTEMDETPMMWGEAGVGKTEMFRYVAWLMQMPFERFSITAKTELDDLAGKMHFSPDEGTHFQYGRLVNAWTKPCVIVLDEPNTGPPEVWQFLRPLTDNSKQLVLDQNNGERISRHPDCYLGMAANPAWDPKNVGAAEIGDADASRLMHVYVPLPPPVLEKEIILNRVALDGWELSDDQIDLIMNVAVEVRSLVKDDTLPITWGIRPQLKVARALKWFTPVDAYKRAIGDFLEPEAQEVLLDVVRSHVDSSSTVYAPPF